ncbi:MAG: family 10 glycosylhydrolase [Pseudomonadota bacterium]|nr:family 10 glycosylhydrolase [Rubrivivax sp.]
MPRSEDRRTLLEAAAAGALGPLTAAPAYAQPAAAQEPAVSPSATPSSAPPRALPGPEVHGTRLTTTADTDIGTPANTVRTVQRLAAMGLNAVYVEIRKKGHTRFPSAVLERAIGVRERPGGARQDPSDGALERPARDLLEETLIEAYRNGLHHLVWFGHGFVVAHSGFAWMNPLHPETRCILLDLTRGAIGRYDLDGVQFDDRIVWTGPSVGHDTFTRQLYAAEHEGRAPQEVARDPAWMKWRATKLDAVGREFFRELRSAMRPAMLPSFSPAVSPWPCKNYRPDWPLCSSRPEVEYFGEVVPQAHRLSYPAFEATWREQRQGLQRREGACSAHELVAGIRRDGDGRDSSWERLRDSIARTRTLGRGGHMPWFSRSALQPIEREPRQFYGGTVAQPRFAPDWRRKSRPPVAAEEAARVGLQRWKLPAQLRGEDRRRRRPIARAARGPWRCLRDLEPAPGRPLPVAGAPEAMDALELLIDRRHG